MSRPTSLSNARIFLADPLSDAASAFMRQTCPGKQTRPKGGRRVRAGVFRQQPSLVDVGLQEVAGGARCSRISGHPPRSVQGQSSPGVEGVEDDDRWANCLGFECRKQEIHRICSGCRWRVMELKF